MSATPPGDAAVRQHVSAGQVDFDTLAAAALLIDGKRNRST
jgi:hypothetical protein